MSGLKSKPLTFLGYLGRNSLGNTTGTGFLVNGSGPFFSGFVTEPTPRKELHKGQLVYTVLHISDAKSHRAPLKWVDYYKLLCLITLVLSNTNC